MIHDLLSMYFGRRQPIFRPLLTLAAVIASTAVPVAASAAQHLAVSAPSAHAAGQGTIARAGQKIAGLTLAEIKTPSPLPTALPLGHPYRPPAGKVFQGVADKPLSSYSDVVGKHAAVYQAFVAWGQYLPGIADEARLNRARLMMMVTTRYGSQNMISPQGLASGAGDDWLIGLGQELAASHNITYMRLMAEMNNCNNAYAAYNCDGSSRGPAYSASEFRQAWRRVALIMRGGVVSLINRQLAHLQMPALRTTLTYLATPQVAMVWVPMVGGSPDIPALEPSVYFPGRRWIDWVGTDFYSRYPNWSGLSSFYSAYAHIAPFAFGEYAIWDGDNPSWAHTLFGWVATHPRTQMMVYNDASPEFWLSHFPASAAVIKGALAAPAFLAYAPEWAPAG